MAFTLHKLQHRHLFFNLLFVLIWLSTSAISISISSQLLDSRGDPVSGSLSTPDLFHLEYLGYFHVIIFFKNIQNYMIRVLQRHRQTAKETDERRSLI